MRCLANGRERHRCALLGERHPIYPCLSQPHLLFAFFMSFMVDSLGWRLAIPFMLGVFNLTGLLARGLNCQPIADWTL